MTAGLLTLIQRLSPGFPVGGYAYSHGLEAAMACGELASADDLQDWLAFLIEQGSGRTDAILLCHALAPEADHAALSDLALALAAGRERAVEAQDQGRAFTETLTRMGEPTPPLAYPVAVGRAAAGLGLPAEVVAAVWLQAFAANLVQAAVRFIPLGAAEGQAVLARLQPLLLRVAAEAAKAPLDTLGAAAFRADLAAMAHETLEVRIFRT